MQNYIFEYDGEIDLVQQRDSEIIYFLNGDIPIEQVLEAFIRQHMNDQKNFLGEHHD